MPLVGLAIGHELGAVLGTAANYAAIGVLLALGIHILVVDEDEREAELSAGSRSCPLRSRSGC